MNTTKNNRSQLIQSATAVASAAALAVESQAAAHLEWERQAKEFLKKIQSDDPETRYNAWNHADKQNPKVLKDLAQLLDSDNPGIVKAAEGAIERIVHATGKDLSSAKAETVRNELMALLDEDSKNIKVFVLRTLSLTAGDDDIPKIAKYTEDEIYQEEAVYCLERIPGDASAKALIAAAKKGSSAFQQRVIAALGNRRDETAVDSLVQAMGSSNHDVAVAAMDALAKIGKAPEGVEAPNYDSLSKRQKAKYMDAALRYFDAKVEQDEMEKARKVIRELRDLPEYQESEHYRCAAIQTMAKVDVEGIRNRLREMAENDPSYIVRDAAKKALRK